ncbi:hypothetical protein KR044_000309 [Drosophila immigrans]|nr:hypothetical protein KR044_000309 [Drosophila immigrans]
MQNDKYLQPEAAQNYPPSPSYSQHAYPPQEPAFAPQRPPEHGYPPQQDFPQQVHPPQGFPPQAQAPQIFTQPAQHYVPPPPPPTTIVLVRPIGCYERSKMNRPQMKVLSAAALVFCTGGMNIAWSVGFRSPVYNGVSNHIRVAWFIGAIIGAAIAAFLPRVIPRRAITLFCSMLVLIGGIVSASTQFNLGALQANLYLNGIANGLVFAPTLALAGELAVYYMRGKISASAEQLSFNLGIVLQIVIAGVYTPSYYHNGFSPDRVSGGLAAVFGFLGLVFAALRFIESPVTMVATGREQAATDALHRLQRIVTPQEQTLAQLEEHKRYVADSNNLSTGESCSQAIPAFLKLTALRCVNAISICSFFSDILYYANTSVNDFNRGHVYFAAARVLGSFLGTLIVDSLGRKWPTVVGLAGATAFAFVAASQMVVGYKDTILWLYFFQLFAGVAFTITSAYLSEAYPLKVKQHFLSFTFIVEMLIFIILGSCDLVQEFLYIVGGICAGALFMCILCLPETRRTTLRIAQQRFSSFVPLCNKS